MMESISLARTAAAKRSSRPRISCSSRLGPFAQLPPNIIRPSSSAANQNPSFLMTMLLGVLTLSTCVDSARTSSHGLIRSSRQHCPAMRIDSQAALYLSEANQSRKAERSKEKEPNSLLGSELN